MASFLLRNCQSNKWHTKKKKKGTARDREPIESKLKANKDICLRRHRKQNRKGRAILFLFPFDLSVSFILVFYSIFGSFFVSFFSHEIDIHNDLCPSDSIFVLRCNINDVICLVSLMDLETRTDMVPLRRAVSSTSGVLEVGLLLLLLLLLFLSL